MMETAMLCSTKEVGVSEPTWTLWWTNNWCQAPSEELWPYHCERRGSSVLFFRW